VGAATANLQALEADLIETRLLLNEQLAGAWASWVSAQNRADMGRNQTQTARSLAHGYEQQFRVGRRSLLDLLNIQSDLFTYQSNAATASHESRLSQARVLASLGQLAQAYTTGTAVPARPSPSPALLLPLVLVNDQDQPDATPTPAE
jgi:outer membrane protein TolC